MNALSLCAFKIPFISVLKIGTLPQIFIKKPFSILYLSFLAHSRVHISEFFNPARLVNRGYTSFSERTGVNLDKSCLGWGASNSNNFTTYHTLVSRS